MRFGLLTLIGLVTLAAVMVRFPVILDWMGLLTCAAIPGVPFLIGLIWPVVAIIKRARRPSQRP
jgi:hypothetical protein